MVVARRCSRPAVLLPAHRQRSVAQPLFCMRSALATPRPRLRQPLRWSHGLCRAPGSQNWQIGLFTGGLVGFDASVYGAFDASPSRPGPRGAGQQRPGDASVFGRLSARDSRHARIIELRTHALATSSAILFFALHARVQESCGRIVELDFGTKLRVDQEAAGWGCQWWHSQPPLHCYSSMAQ